MRGFSFVIVIVLVLVMVPIIATESKVASGISTLEAKFIDNQMKVNLQNDVIRTFRQALSHCKSDGDCKVYISEWIVYWSKEGFTIFSGDTHTGIKDSINVDIVNGKAVLRPKRNISNYGITMTGPTTVIINRGVWYEGTGEH